MIDPRFLFLSTEGRIPRKHFWLGVGAIFMFQFAIQSTAESFGGVDTARGVFSDDAGVLPSRTTVITVKSVLVLRMGSNPGTDKSPCPAKIRWSHTISGMGMNLGTQGITL